MKPPKRRSLDDYATENPSCRSRVCSTCSLPERPEVDAGWTKGRTLTQIMGWLVTECGYKKSDLRAGSFRYHFGKGHHEGGS